MDKKKKKRKTIILAIILAICTLVNITYYSISEKVYAAAVIPPLTIGSETVLSLLISACAASGICNAVKSQAEIEAMEEAERQKYYNSIAVSDKELMKMVYDEGYFDGTGIEDLVQSAVYGSDAESAIDKFKAKIGLADKDLFKVGGNKAPGENGKISAILAGSVVALKNISDKLKSSFLGWAAKIALANQTELVLPSALPSPVSYYNNYIVLTSSYYDKLYTINNGVYCIMYHSNRNVERIYTNRRGCWILETGGWYLYALINGEWVQKEYLSGDGSSYAYVDLDYINQGPANIMYNNHTIKEQNIWSEPTPYPTDAGGSPTEITPEEACDMVNDYISKLGYSTRLSADLLTNESDVWAGTESNIDNWDCTTDKLLSIDDVTTAVRELVVPISTAVEENKAASADITNMLNDIREQISAGEQTIVNSVSRDLTAEDVTDISGVPASSNFGPLNAYKVDGLDDVFPFCIPFDIYRCIKVLCADAEAPRWEFPFVIQSLGINETIVLDMSKYESVAKICRWVETLIFIYGLAAKTKAFMFT